MCHKVFAIVFIAIAVILGLAVSMMSQESLAFLVPVSKFFDVMLPILAVGALIKYLCKHDHKCGVCGCASCNCANKKAVV